VKLGTAIRRFLIPGFVVQWIYFLRCRALVSARAEVELSSKARLGKGTVIGSFTKVKVVGPFVTGTRVHIGPNCFLEAGEAGMEIGDDVMIGPSCTFVTTAFNYGKVGIALPDQGHTSKRIVIGKRTWISSNCSILGGVTIGEDVIVTPGAVVQSDIPDRAIVQGNPAKPVFVRR
jgi:acetyltransferase-like isoleucine patch superfamily enzyme